jgi:hypothetical protein
VSGAWTKKGFLGGALCRAGERLPAVLLCKRSLPAVPPLCEGSFALVLAVSLALVLAVSLALVLAVSLALVLAVSLASDAEAVTAMTTSLAVVAVVPLVSGADAEFSGMIGGACEGVRACETVRSMHYSHGTHSSTAE